MIELLTGAHLVWKQFSHCGICHPGTEYWCNKAYGFQIPRRGAIKPIRLIDLLHLRYDFSPRNQQTGSWRLEAETGGWRLEARGLRLE